MKDERKTKKQLVNELVETRQRISELETPETKRKRTREAQDKEPNRLRILAVDDNRAALDFYQEVLCPTGDLRKSESTTGDLEAKLLGNRPPKASIPSFDVILCHQGDEAVETVRAAIGRNEPFAVVFLDVRMPPGPDGVWTAEHIRALDPYVQIVMVTAYSDVDPADIACRVPPVKRLFYVQKPFDPGELRQFAFALGAKWHAERQVRKIHVELEDRVEERTAELRTANEQLQQEITERKRAETQLRESEERYRGVVENIGIGVSLISPNMEILTLNNQMKEWFPDIDVSKKPICYRSFNSPPREDICSYCPTYKTLEDGQVHESITDTPAGDEIKNYRIISSPIRDKAGKVIAAIEMVEDITERKQAQEALRESEEKYKSIIESVHDVIFQLSPSGFIQYVSPKVEELYGYKPEDLIGKHLKKTTPLGEVPKALAALRSVLSGKTIRNLEINQLKSKGKTIPMEINATPVKKEGKIIAVQGVMRDITERKRAEEALERQDKERIKFINAVIHEIKTPVTAMLASSELLKEELLADSSPLSSLVENLNIATHNLNRRISELMDFAMVRSTGFVLQVQCVDICQLAQYSAAQVHALLQNKFQTLDLQLPTSHPQVEADPERVVQIFLNLLTNASKFSPPHSEISLRAYPADNQLIVEVRDSAPPIGRKEAKLIFNPYYLGKKAGGCGLGLSVCKRLVELQRGKIWVETQVKGNSFKFSLPLAGDSRFRAEDGT